MRLIFFVVFVFNSGEKIFLGNVSSRILQMEGRVNGHHLHNAVTLDTNQTFLGALHLQSGFTVPHADLSITTVNQIDWEVMRDKGVHPAILERQGLGKNVTFRNLCSIGGSLTAAQFKVNGEKLDDVLSDVVYTVNITLIFIILTFKLLQSILSEHGRHYYDRP